jgi:hypothetical protein
VSLSNPRAEYTSRLSARRASLASEQARHVRLGNARIALFLVLLSGLFAAFLWHLFSGWWLVLPLAGLLTLGRRLEAVERRVARGQRAVEFYERGLARLDHQWLDTGEDGKRFLDESHPYAVDLDILGRGSVFQFLCVARTERGLQTLAQWLLHCAELDVVAARQASVQELAAHLDVREDLAISGPPLTLAGSADALAAWGEGNVRSQRPVERIVSWVLSVLGALALCAGVVYLAGEGFHLVAIDADVLVLLQAYFVTVTVVCVGVHWVAKRWTDSALSGLLRAEPGLGVVGDILARLEREIFNAPRLASLRAAFVQDRASFRITRLRVLASLAAARRNAVMTFVGPVLLWDLHVGRAVEEWRRQSGPSIGGWLQAVGEVEALASLAAFAWERSDTVYPNLLADGPRFAAKELHHPLLPIDRAVSNDIALDHAHSGLVVSGSNMSGKSTFLRTVGVNAVLANAGGPVCARRAELSRLEVCASIRIQDSLQDGTSRFYAEISRISHMMATARGPVPVLFLIDEILHGTNSHDRLIGAEAVVRALVEQGAIGLITTHDLALARLVDTLGSRARNVHFQDYLENGQLRFDYRLYDGVVQHSNALQLMRSVGLDV